MAADDDRAMTDAERRRESRRRKRNGKIRLTIWADEVDVVAALQKHRHLTADEADQQAQSSMPCSSIANS